jgi:hypothetical protein
MDIELFSVLKQDPELWDIFTRKEEYDPILLDSNQRFRYSYSKHQNSMEPMVSNYLYEHGYKVKYPGNKEFALCLTHDIDNFNYTGFDFLVFLGKQLRKLKVANSTKFLMGKINPKSSPFWNFSEIMELESKYGGKSTFYFLVKPCENPPGVYAWDESHIILYVKRIIVGGITVSSHENVFTDVSNGLA